MARRSPVVRACLRNRKDPDAQIVVASNAGYNKDRSWQYEVRETARIKSWGHLFSPPGPHASWISKEWVER